MRKMETVSDSGNKQPVILLLYRAGHISSMLLSSMSENNDLIPGTLGKYFAVTGTGTMFDVQSSQWKFHLNNLLNNVEIVIKFFTLFLTH